MNQMADSSVALTFVIGRIEEQAMLSGEPLSEDQRLLLNNLPSVSSVPEISMGDPEVPVHFVPRDRSYGRLCALAKAARHKDVQLNPASLDWDFAFAVTKLNHRPLSWVLQWAGVKQRRPRWDRWLLIIAAVLFIAATIPLMLLVIDRPWAWWRWAIVFIGYVGAVVAIYFAARRIERRQLELNVERCRGASRFANVV